LFRDETRNYLRDENLKSISNIQNLGVSASRNIGASEASSDWLCFLDSDDEWRSDKLQVLHDAITSHQEIKFFHTNELWIRNGVRVNPPKKYDKGVKDIFKRSLDFCIISPSTSCIHKNLFKKYNGFNEDYPVCEDYDLWLKILAQNKIHYIDEALTTKYAGHEDQLSFKYKAMDFYRVLSLHKLLESFTLDAQIKGEAIKQVIKKSNILLNGYNKYPNPDNSKVIRNILENYIS
jgi:glycosyltransferase involved in cell wall biosynthesis